MSQAKDGKGPEGGGGDEREEGRGEALFPLRDHISLCWPHATQSKNVPADRVHGEPWETGNFNKAK
jgi:hypothetical protein